MIESSTGKKRLATHMVKLQQQQLCACAELHCCCYLEGLQNLQQLCHSWGLYKTTMLLYDGTWYNGNSNERAVW